VVVARPQPQPGLRRADDLVPGGAGQAEEGGVGFDDVAARDGDDGDGHRARADQSVEEAAFVPRRSLVVAGSLQAVEGSQGGRLLRRG
jgi:hypothetical protein